MHRVNGYPLYWLGTSLGALSAKLAPEVTYGEIAQQAYWSTGALEYFVSDEFITLPGSQRAARLLIGNLQRILETAGRSGMWDVAVEVSDTSLLTTGIAHLGSVLSSELSQANTFFVVQVRGWDTDTLINEADRVLDEESRSLLPALAKTDMKEAGRCLAFDLPTAVGFHVFRAVESVVKEYFPIFELSLPPEEKRGIGPYLGALKPGLDSKIEGMLVHLKDHYRNPLMHPDLVLERDEAANVFSFAQSAISQMLLNQCAEREKRA